MFILPKLIHSFNAIPIKIPTRFFIATDEIILKFKKKSKRTRKLKQFRKRMKEITLPYFETVSSVVVKVVWDWQRI